MVDIVVQIIAAKSGQRSQAFHGQLETLHQSLNAMLADKESPVDSDDFVIVLGVYRDGLFEHSYLPLMKISTFLATKEN